MCSIYRLLFFYDWWMGTCAVVDCTQMNDLATAVRNELLAFADSIPTLSFDDVQQYGAGSYHDFSYDVGDFFEC